MFTIDATKDKLSNSINQHQLDLNYNSTERQRILKQSDLFIPRTLTNSENNSPKFLSKGLANIQKEQIELKRMDVANDLIKSRIQDEENLMSIHQRFPYGKENVVVSEDVLERYKGNYIEQSRVLEKFRLEAELKKKRPVAKPQVKPTPMKDWKLREEIIPTVHKKNDDYMLKLRERLQKQLEEERALKEFEKNNLKNIANTLSALSSQLNNNSYALEKGIKELHEKFKRTEQRNLERPLPHLPYKDSLDIETVNQKQKIPVVIYEGKAHDARVYFSDLNRNNSFAHSEEAHVDVHKEEYKEIVRVLNENNRKLAYLGELEKLSH